MSLTTDRLSPSSVPSAERSDRQPVIEVIELYKSFGDTIAVDGLSFSVAAGSILGVLGPNGAGKTTTIRMLSTLISIDGGRASIAGFDVASEPSMVRRAIGVAGQSAAVDEKLTTWQNLDLFGRLYHLPSATRQSRVDTLVERFGMGEYRDRLAGTLSGGQRRRLDLVAALIADPPVVFLDEPTAGLDPRGRLALWEQIKVIRDDGAAVLLTTQYLEEADQLADAIVIVDKGRAVARGTAAELKAHLQRDVLEVTFADDDSRAAAEKVLDAKTLTIFDERTLHLSVSTATDSMTALRRLQEGGIGIAGFELRRPTLDDVFIDLTGGPADRDARSGADEEEEQAG